MAENAFSDVPVAVVTGGSAGLGFEIASHFAKNGYHLVLVGRNEERLKTCLLYTSPSPRDVEESRMPSSA